MTPYFIMPGSLAFLLVFSCPFLKAQDVATSIIMNSETFVYRDEIDMAILIRNDGTMPIVIHEPNLNYFLTVVNEKGEKVKYRCHVNYAIDRRTVGPGRNVIIDLDFGCYHLWRSPGVYHASFKLFFTRGGIRDSVLASKTFIVEDITTEEASIYRTFDSLLHSRTDPSSNRYIFPDDLTPFLSLHSNRRIYGSLLSRTVNFAININSLHASRLIIELITKYPESFSIPHSMWYLQMYGAPEELRLAREIIDSMTDRESYIYRLFHPEDE